MGKMARTAPIGAHQRLGDCFLLVDERMNITFIDPARKDLLSQEARVLVGENLWDVFPMLKETRFAAACMRVLESQNPEIVEEDFPAWQGRYECRVFPVLGGLFITFAESADPRRPMEGALREMLEHSPDAIAAVDLDSGEIVYLNHEAFCGYTLKDLIAAESVWTGVHEEDLQSVKTYWERIRSSDYLDPIEYRLKCKDGNWLWIRQRTRTITRTTSGAPEQILITLTDITPEKQTEEAHRQREEALRDSERRYQLIASSASDYMFSCHFDSNGQLQLEWTAGGFEAVTGYTVEEYIARGGLRATLHPDDLAILDLDLEKVRARQPINSEYRTYKKDGEMVWVKVYASPVLSDNGQEVIGLIGAVQDITERKKAEQALAESEAYLRETQALGKVGSWKYNPATQSITWSEETYRLYERDPSMGPPTTEEEAAYYTPEQAQILREYIRLVITEGCEAQCDLEVHLPSGKIAVFFVRMRPEKNELGQVVNIFGTVQDITERKRAEEEIKQRLDELVTVNRISTVLNEARNLQEMLPNLLDETLALLKSDTGAIFLSNGHDAKLDRAVEYGWKNLKDGPHSSEINDMVELAFTTGETKIYSWDGTLLSDDPQDTSLVNGLRSFFCAPIRAEHTIVGVFFAAINTPLSDIELRLLATVSEISGNAILRARLNEQTLQQMQRLTVLHEIDQAINSVMDLDLLLFILLSHITSQLHMDAADILLLDIVEKKLEFKTGIGFHTKDAFKYREPISNDLIGQALRKKSLVFEPDVTSPEAIINNRIQRLQGEDFKAHIVAPIIVKGETKGVLELFHRTPFDPDPDWLNFLETLVGQTAIAMDSAMMFADLLRTNKELADAYDATIEGWAMALDLRDKETKNHTKRVAEITVRLARQMGIDDSQLIHIRRGALLHDIGKLSVPDHVLFKPGSLTAEEQEIMHRHPQQAYEMLYPIEYLRPALDIPYCHHEKWDGTGYPRGLKGEEIPLAARIFAVADVFDALISERPYRKAWPYAQALNWIYEQAGKHFDPEVVGVFLSMFHTGKLSALP